MGRKHKQDKLYKTVTELQSHHQGADRDLELSVLHRRLKFDTCCLSLNSFTDKPMGLCDNDGYCYVFEADKIIKYLERFRVHPITGEKVDPDKLFELKFHKNDDGQYHCPIIYKLFNQHSKIVANKKTGNVYSYDAYAKLNLTPKSFRDLLTDEPFTREDIVTIQDPALADTKWAVTEFHYVKKNHKLEEDNSVSNIRDIEKSSILESTLNEFKSKSDSIVKTFNRIVGQTSESDKGESREQLDKINSAIYSDGALSSSVTSTVAPVVNAQKAALLNEEQILYPRIRKKGYVQMVTNFGPINLELYCDRTPKTCHNFLLLASRGYYDGTIFHRLIKNFIIQGGDPTGTGTGGQSAWGKPFEDECHGDLKHVGRGVLSMANSGPNTNKSQFYITLRGEWEHLDGKHTVFGRVVGGDETLEKIDRVEVDKKEKPKQEIKILSMTIYVDPFAEVQNAIEEERARLSKSANDCVGVDRTSSSGSKRDNSELARPVKKFRSGIGSYIDLDAVRRQQVTGCRQVSGGSISKSEGFKGNSDSLNNESSLADRLAAVGGDRSNQKSGHTKAQRSFGDFSNW